MVQKNIVNHLITKIVTLLNTKLNKNLGTSNANKMVVVGTDGNVTCADKPKAVYDATAKCVKIQ